MTTKPNSPVFGHPPDGYDRMFSDYFKNEMPNPWPGPQAMATAEPARRSADNGIRSRYTLAASVAVLLGLGAYLSSGPPTGHPSVPQPGLLKDASASGGKLLEHAAPKAVEHNPMSIPEMP
jgi:hypothetical protein